MSAKSINRINYRKKKKQKKKQYKIIDRLFYQIFFSSLCLLILSYFTIVNTRFSDIIHSNINYNFNFLSLSNKIDQLFAMKLFNKGEITVYSATFYEEVVYDNEINYVSNSSFAGVENLVDGIVIKISKDNLKYSVTILAADDTLYCYQDLESIDVRLYNYVESKEVIGKAIYQEDLYQFKLLITKDNQNVSYYENAED